MKFRLDSICARIVSNRRRSVPDPIGRQRTALVLEPRSGQLAIRRIRPWTRILTHLLAGRLDCQLAAGSRPESSLLLAVRAQHLVSPAQRLAVAMSWAQMTMPARRSRTGRCLRLPLCHDRISAAGNDIRAMVRCLADASPTSARGMAMLLTLQRRGDGPLFNPRSREDLSHAIKQATDALDPIVNAYQ
jgi:hypothetical protein